MKLESSTCLATLLGSLPPIKGISPYCQGLSEGLVEQLGPGQNLLFQGFKAIYPEAIYPGGTRDPGQKTPEWPGKIEVAATLTWYNPLTWLRAGFRARGKVLHAQWWSYVLAPIYLVILLIARARGKKILLTIHNVNPHESSRVAIFLNRLIFRLAHGYVVHNQPNKDTLRKEFSIGNRPVYVIPHGILLPEIARQPEEQFQPNSLLNKKGPVRALRRAQTLREKHQIPADALVVLFFGNIRPYKGVSDLVAAHEQLKARKGRPVFLAIAGKNWEKEGSAWEKQVEANPLARYYSGFVSEQDLEELFFLADCVVLPYREFDSASGVASLALGFEKPLVVSNVGGLPELTAGADFQFSPGNVDELASCLQVIRQKPKLLLKMADHSRALARELAWGNIAGQTLAAYRDLTGD